MKSGFSTSENMQIPLYPLYLDHIATTGGSKHEKNLDVAYKMNRPI